MMFLPVILLLAFLAVTCTAQDVFTSPDLLELLNEIEDMSHDEYFADVRQSGLAQTAEVCRTAQADMVFDMLREPNTATPRKKLGLTLNLNIRPVVLAHGMGDTGYGYVSIYRGEHRNTHRASDSPVLGSFLLVVCMLALACFI